MTNLIFDLNNIAHRSLFVVGGYGSKQLSFDSQSEIDQLMRKMAMDVAFLTRIINPSRIFFAQDSTSWRKDINIDENEGYKGQRKYSSTINWDKVYKALDEFTQLMENNGLIITKIPKAEADDIIAMWSHELAGNQHQHVIIVTGDEDMRQLVKDYEYEDIRSFVTVFNPFMQGKNSSRKLFVCPKFEEWINAADVVDFMNMKGTINVDKEDFNKIRGAEKTRMEVIDGPAIALRKIFCGDDGDNIPAIFSWMVKDKSGEDKVVRFTNSKFEKLIQFLSANGKYPTYNELIDKHEQIKLLVQELTKQAVPFDMKNRIIRQLKLVVLNENFFPQEIVNAFHDLKQDQLDKPRINYGNVNMRDLLEGTRYITEKKQSSEARYITEKKQSSEASIFKQIDRINTKSNPLF